METEIEPTGITESDDSTDPQRPSTTPPTGGSVDRVRPLVEPIVADLGVEIYDLEHRGGILRLTITTPMGSPGGVTLETIALTSRLVSKELDAVDPIASRYTLEVTSPGIERSLRVPEHYRRAIGEQVAVRLIGVEAADRRVAGTVVDADDQAVTVDVDGDRRRIDYDRIDRARTVFEWAAQPKGGAKKGAPRRAGKQSDRPESSPTSDQTRPVGPENAMEEQ